MKKGLLLKTESLTKRFDQTTAVNNVFMEVFRGEIHGLIGENGSGKSTLTSMIAGVHKPTSGRMYLDGKEYRPKSQIDASRSGISIIVQEMNTIDGLSVAENIFFGYESQYIKFGLLNKKAMIQKAEEYLAAFDLAHIDPMADISFYNFEERKLVELVKAVYHVPKLLVVDETTTVLSHQGREQLFRVIHTLKENGSTVIIISHDLSELITLCDRITVLRDGNYIVSLENNGITEDELKVHMIGREFSGGYYRKEMRKCVRNETVLSVRDISLTGILSNISFELFKGEILGIGGLAESGMHELGKVLFGMVRPDTGTVTLSRKNLLVNEASKAIRYGIAYTSKNRDQEGLMLNASIMDNICIGNLDILGTYGFILPNTEKCFSQIEAEKLQTKMENVFQFTSSLSGGNKQKVVLAKWLGRNSEIFILDSPTRGVDVKVKAVIYSLMQKLTDEGKTIVMISEELIELIGMCDRLLVLRDGQISGELMSDEGLSEEKIIHLMI